MPLEKKQINSVTGYFMILVGICGIALRFAMEYSINTFWIIKLLVSLCILVAGLWNVLNTDARKKPAAELTADDLAALRTKKIAFLVSVFLIPVAIAVLFFAFPPIDLQQQQPVISIEKTQTPVATQEQALQNDTLDVSGKFNVEITVRTPDGDSTGVKINIRKDGKLKETIASEGTQRHIALDFDSSYLIECFKPGYATKIFYVDTKIPKGREKEEFAKFVITVELFKNKPNETRDLSKPVGGISYDKTSGDFEQVKK